jgi:hypothetical protein
MSFTENFSKHSESFRKYFKFFNFKKYSLSKQSYVILLNCQLSDKDELRLVVIFNDEELIRLISEDINNPNIWYYIEERPLINQINFSLYFLDNKIISIFNDILHFQTKRHSLKYINFITFLTSEYFSEKIKQNQLNLFQRDLKWIISKISQLKHQYNLEKDIYWTFSKLQFHLIIN